LARMGQGGVGVGALGTKGGVSRNERKYMSSTEKAEEDGRAYKGRESSKVTSREMHIQ
jgi:hypothetical protein